MYEFLSAVLHIDQGIAAITAEFGALVYALLFLIIFLETGLVVTPFLPGDSLLFAAGALAAIGSLSYPALLAILFLAAVLGDTVNYWIGFKLGTKLLQKIPERFLNPKHVATGEKFYDEYGGYALITARFVPIARTFVPFVAGLAKMNYSNFLMYNLAGAAVWVGVLVTAGYFFGNLPIIKDNFGLTTLAIIAISFLPPVLKLWKERRARHVEE